MLCHFRPNSIPNHSAANACTNAGPDHTVDANSHSAAHPRSNTGNNAGTNSYANAGTNSYTNNRSSRAPRYTNTNTLYSSTSQWRANATHTGIPAVQRLWTSQSAGHDSGRIYVRPRRR